MYRFNVGKRNTPSFSVGPTVIRHYPLQSCTAQTSSSVNARIIYWMEIFFFVRIACKCEKVNMEFTCQANFHELLTHGVGGLIKNSLIFVVLIINNVNNKLLEI